MVDNWTRLGLHAWEVAIRINKRRKARERHSVKRGVVSRSLNAAVGDSRKREHSRSNDAEADDENAEKVEDFASGHGASKKEARSSDEIDEDRAAVNAAREGAALSRGKG